MKEPGWRSPLYFHVINSRLLRKRSLSRGVKRGDQVQSIPQICPLQIPLKINWGSLRWGIRGVTPKWTKDGKKRESERENKRDKYSKTGTKPDWGRRGKKKKDKERRKVTDSWGKELKKQEQGEACRPIRVSHQHHIHWLECPALGHLLEAVLASSWGHKSRAQACFPRPAGSRCFQFLHLVALMGQEGHYSKRPWIHMTLS